MRPGVRRGRVVRVDKGSRHGAHADGTVARAPGGLSRRDRRLGARRGRRGGRGAAAPFGLRPRRPDRGRARRTQVVAANVDIVFIVQSLTNGPNVRRLDASSCWLREWRDTVCRPVEGRPRRDRRCGSTRHVDDVSGRRRRRSSRCHAIRRRRRRLRTLGRANRTVAFIGASGVGKSTLVNGWSAPTCRPPATCARTTSAAATRRPRASWCCFPGGGVLVDTPGLRAVSLWDADEG